MRRSETKGLGEPVVNISSSLMTMLYVPRDGWSQSSIHFKKETWQGFLDLLTYLANSNETVTFSGSEESNYSTTYSFWTDTNRYLVTLPKPDLGLPGLAIKTAPTKAQSTSSKLATWLIDRMPFDFLVGLMKVLKG